MTDIDYSSDMWKQGYRDGYLGDPFANSVDPNYKEGYIMGEAEQDAPEDMIDDPKLFAERLRRTK